MFSLDGGAKYWLYNKPVDMRKSFNGLSGIVTNGMSASLRSGDVYIFMNASRNMMKMLRQEEGGLVLYAIRLDMGRMKPAIISSDEDVIFCEFTQISRHSHRKRTSVFGCKSIRLLNN